MRITVLILAIFLCFTVEGQVHVNGYYRSNGTYVQPHMRSSPDGNPYNNYSYPGNANPYTGEIATGDPDTYLKNYYDKSSSPNSSDVWVNGYYKSDGTYVDGHWRSAPNGSPNDNWSYPGNTNPHTGKTSTGNSDSYLKNNGYSSSTYNNYGKTNYVNSNSLNFRSGPSTNYSVLATLSFGESVEIIGTVNSHWTKVRVSYFDGYNFRSGTGYVYSAYLSSNNPIFSNSNNQDFNYLQAFNNYVSNGNSSASYHPYGYNNGRVTLWTDCSDDGQISVYIDGHYRGQITKYFSGDQSPECGGTGTLDIILSVGYYKLKAKGNKYEWEGFLQIMADDCLLKKLEK